MTETARTPGFVLRTPGDLDQLDFDRDGGDVLVVVQDCDSGRVLLVARADREAMQQTLSTGEMWFRSRTRGLWHKGATSGNTQRVVELRGDCDGDTVLALVRPKGPACHTGKVSCFGEYAPSVLARLDAVIASRAAAAPAGSYTARLMADRNLRLKKLGEEVNELTVACADGDAGRAAEEAADVLFHTAVALHAAGTALGRALAVLAARERTK